MTTTLAIAAIMKNEAPYLLEWVAWHRMLGVEKFFICDNDSNDGMSDILSALDAENIVNHIPFPGTPGVSPQLPAYAHIMQKHGADADWVAFIDADELIEPQGSVDLPSFLSSLPPDVGLLALNWAIYGSSGRIVPGQGYMMDRFRCRAVQEARHNRNYKSIVRSQAYAKNSKNPHHFMLKAGYNYINSEKDPLTLVTSERFGISKEVIWTNFRINHYVIKSWSEFRNKKASRGRATTRLQRNDTFFFDHDQNSENDIIDQTLYEKFLITYDNLVNILRNRGIDYDHNRFLNDISTTLPDEPTSDTSFIGDIDEVRIDGDVVFVTGWALDTRDGSGPETELYINNILISEAVYQKTERRDIAEKYMTSTPVCGFKFTFSSRFLGRDADETYITIRRPLGSSLIAGKALG